MRCAPSRARRACRSFSMARPCAASAARRSGRARMPKRRSVSCSAGRVWPIAATERYSSSAGAAGRAGPGRDRERGAGRGGYAGCGERDQRRRRNHRDGAEKGREDRRRADRDDGAVVRGARRSQDRRRSGTAARGSEHELLQGQFQHVQHLDPRIGTKREFLRSTDPAVADEFNNTPLIRNRLFESGIFSTSAAVEVLRGPRRERSMDRNAPGGVVNIIPAHARNPGFEGSKSKGEVGNYKHACA